MKSSINVSTSGSPRRSRLRRTAALFLFSAVCAAVPAQQEPTPRSGKVTLRELLGELPGQESSIRISGSTTKSSFEEYRNLFSRSLPQVYFNTDSREGPLYGFSAARVAVNPQDPSSGETVRVDTHLSTPGFQVTQVLPTAGTLALALSDAVTVVNSGENSLVSQAPSLSLSLLQPMFLNGKIIDFSLFRTTLRTGEVGWEKSKTAETAAVNKAVTGAASLYLNAVRLNKQAVSFERAIGISLVRQKQLEVSFQQGQASRSEVRELDLSIGEQREALLELRYRLKEMLRSLSRMTGRENLAVENLSDELSFPELPADSAAILRRALANNTDVVTSRLNLELTRLQGVLNGREFQSDLSVSFRLTPEYPVDRPARPVPGGGAYDTGSFSASWADLFAPGSRLDYSAGVGLRVPLFTGGQKAHKRASQAATESAALEGLEATGRSVSDAFELVNLKRGYLSERVALFEETVAHQEELLRKEEKLLELRATTPIEVETAKLDLDDARDKLWFSRAELYLNSLDLLVIAGENLAAYPGIVGGGMPQ